MSFTQITVIANGALESEHTFYDDCGMCEVEMANLIEGTKVYAGDAVVEIYSLHHDHDAVEDCECIQYETDHHPIWSNASDNH